MSFIINKNDLDNYWKEFIKKNCNIWGLQSEYTIEKELITIFKVNNNQVIIPLALWKDICLEFPNNYTNYIKINRKIEFVGKLQEDEKRDQITVMKESISLLEKNNSILLALRTGFGKTACMFYLISYYGMKTVILSYSNKLHTQYIEQGNKWCPTLKIQIVKDDKLDPNYDVYIIGIIKCTHIDNSQFKNIGMVFVDEAQLTLTNTFSDALLQFTPKYLIGLSATPDRKDGKHQLLYPFFGKKEEFIVRHQKKEFTIIKYLTNIKPIIKDNKIGKLDWNALIASLSSNEKRQRAIVDLCIRYSDKRILILCKRVCTILGCDNYSKCNCVDINSIGLIPLLKEKGENVDYCAYTKKEPNEECRILIGTFGKLGVGYDSNRELLILETDVVDVRQYEGRIRSDNNIVIDIVDKFYSLEKHWKEREQWYINRGATIELEYLDKNLNEKKIENKHIKLI